MDRTSGQQSTKPCISASTPMHGVICTQRCQRWQSAKVSKKRRRNATRTPLQIELQGVPNPLPMTPVVGRGSLGQPTDAQRHRQSGSHESGPRDLPQSDGNTSRRRQKLSPTTWKVRSLLSSETTHPALHQWTSETLHQDRHLRQVLAVPIRVPRQVHTEGRTVTQT